jgi:hypothetical protein
MRRSATLHWTKARMHARLSHAIGRASCVCGTQLCAAEHECRQFYWGTCNGGEPFLEAGTCYLKPFIDQPEPHKCRNRFHAHARARTHAHARTHVRAHARAVEVAPSDPRILQLGRRRRRARAAQCYAAVCVPASRTEGLRRSSQRAPRVSTSAPGPARSALNPPAPHAPFAHGRFRTLQMHSATGVRRRALSVGIAEQAGRQEPTKFVEITIEGSPVAALNGLHACAASHLVDACERDKAGKHLHVPTHVFPDAFPSAFPLAHSHLRMCRLRLVPRLPIRPRE